MGIFNRFFGREIVNEPPVEVVQAAAPPWHQPLIEDVVKNLIQILPAHWNEAELELVALKQALGQGLSHVITNRDGQRDNVAPTIDLRRATRNFELASVEHDNIWIAIKIRVHRKGGGDWGFNVQFAYPE